MKPRFIVDRNVGKLAKWLRVMGYDTLFPQASDDNELVRLALEEGRVILTKDSHILRRRVATSGRLKVLLIEGSRIKEQLSQVVQALNLERSYDPFSLCIECNEPLVPRGKEELREVVPPYVFRTQDKFVECPTCHRIYWRGTHWRRMKGELGEITGRKGEEDGLHL